MQVPYWEDCADDASFPSTALVLLLKDYHMTQKTKKLPQKKRAELALTFTRFLHAQTMALNAFADMPIKYRNVFLPMVTVILQNSFEVLKILRLALIGLESQEIAQATVELNTMLQEEKIHNKVQISKEELTLALEIALTMKAISAGRVALVLEALAKV